jgi:hypothetical protein
MSDPTPTALLQLKTPSILLTAPLHRTPRRQEDAMDIFELPTNDDRIQYLLDVAMEVRNHVRATHVHRSSIKKELLEVLDFTRNLQVIVYLKISSYKCGTEKFNLEAVAP